ncbi:MAG: hypothetical protein F6K28_15130 [Microcoleus sp. SIO2G3]|nr:hypothetical protein [Microcoleus sp. SIO2G3]
MTFTVRQISTSGVYEFNISGNNVVWQGNRTIEEYVIDFGEDAEIFLYNGSHIIQLTNNSFYDPVPRISGNNIVWTGGFNNDAEIFLYNGSNTTQITDNTQSDSGVQIFGNNVVWWG